jgi:phosphomannomutase/phosphoglucomutase
MLLPKSIFRDYDIRGVYPTELNEEIANVIGKAVGTYVIERGGESIVVGRDNRSSSLFLADALIKGLLSTGLNVTHLGITLTPVVHFLTCGTDYHAGVVVTASHNPKEFNGFRIDLQGAIQLYGQELKKLLPIIENKRFVEGVGEYKEQDLTQNYIEYFVSKFKFKNKLKVVFDCGNGASSDLVPELFSKLNLDIIPTYCSFDSEFPHGVPDPENPLFLKDLQQAVLDNKADLGIGFDTDGDRVGFVDDKGQSYSTDQMLMLFAKDTLKSNPGKKVIFDVKSTGVLSDFIKQNHGVPVMIRTGHPYFVGLKDNLAVGAEFSGHVYFYDKYFGFDDGIYAACRLLEILDREDAKLSELMKSIPKRVGSPEFKVACPDNTKFEVVRRIHDKIKNSSDFSNVIDIDGTRASISDTAWFLIRASNTNPYLSIRMEGSSEHEIEVIRKQVSALLSDFHLKLS